MVKRKIPSKDMVTSIMKEVLLRRRVVTTLTEMRFLVLTNLKKINRLFVISHGRIKRLAVQVPQIEVKTKTKRSERKTITSCPVCHKSLSRVYAKNLIGKRINVGYRCNNCGYRSDAKTSVPMRYTFVYKPS